MTIRRIAIVHHSHADFGYTDHPEVCIRMQAQYVAEALSHIREKTGDRQFRWTCEVSEPVSAFWRQASPDERRRLLDALRDGSMEIGALPFNVTPFMDAQEWDEAFTWLPADIIAARPPTCLMQTDVNGIPRAALRRAVDRGVRFVWTGPNSWLGGPPFPPYSYFHWRLPDGRQVLVYQNNGYNNGFYLFNDNWRLGPVPAACDMSYRRATGADYFKTDPDSLHAAHEHCLRMLKSIEGASGGEAMDTGVNAYASAGSYAYDVLPVSVTGQWRFDNDPPFPALADFVHEWNRMGLTPALELTTPTNILDEMETRFGDQFPTVEGDWPDWWANGSASTPQPLAASRQAKRDLKLLHKVAADSPSVAALRRECLRDLIWFDEHTWGSWGSIGWPDSLATHANAVDKFDHAFRPQALAAWKLSDCLRPKLAMDEKGIVVGNFTDTMQDQWLVMEAEAFRNGVPAALQDAVTGRRIPLLRRPGPHNFAVPAESECSIENHSRQFPDLAPDRTVLFRTGPVPPNDTRKLLFSNDLQYVQPKAAPALQIETDENGWPVCCRTEHGIGWFHGNFGAFIGHAIEDSPSPRREFARIFNLNDAQERMAESLKKMPPISAIYKKAKRLDDGDAMVFEQEFSHPFLLCGTRRLELYPELRQLRLQLHLNRKESALPQIWFAQFCLDADAAIPFLSGGGDLFQPWLDQIDGTCHDFYAIDGPVVYRGVDAVRVWNSRDAALVTLGTPLINEKRTAKPERPDCINAMLFNDFWDTNFAVGQAGPLDFAFQAALLPPDTTTAIAMKTAEDMGTGLHFALQQ